MTMHSFLTQLDSAGKYSELTGVILAGGASTRMGRDKSLLALRGKSFIAILTELFQAQFSQVVISADDQEKFSFLHVPVIPDMYPSSGPLGGIHAALMNLQTSHAFVVSCDTPLLSKELINHIVAMAHPDRVTIGRAGNNIHPLLGIYPETIVNVLEDHLSSGKRKVVDVMDTVKANVLDLSPWEYEIRNINTFADYQRMKITKGV